MDSQAFVCFVAVVIVFVVDLVLCLVHCCFVFSTNKSTRFFARGLSDDI